jgi:hypothetical protein
MAKLYAYQLVGDGLVLLTPIGAEHPEHGLPGGGGAEHPDQGLPGWPDRPVHLPGRPGRPGRPDQGLPGGGGIPDHELPPMRPPTVLPGWTLVLVRTPAGQWKYATLAPSSPPPRPLPEPIPPGGQPDQGLPPQPPQPDQGLPGGGAAPAPTPTAR